MTKYLFFILILSVSQFSMAQVTPWVKQQNRHVNEKLFASKHKKNLEKQIRAFYDKENVIATDYTANIQLIDRGLGKPQEIILKIADKPDSVLFSSYQIKRNNTVHITKFTRSPDQKNLLISIVREGSTDDGQLVVLDIATKVLLLQGLNIKYADFASWKTDDVISYYDSQDNILLYSLLKKSQITEQEFNDMTKPPSETPGIDLSKFPDHDLIGSIGSFYYFERSGKHGLGEIVKVADTNTADVSDVQLVSSDEQGLLDQSEIQSDTLMASRSWGGKHKIQLYDINGTLSDVIIIPEFSFVNSINWSATGKILIVKLKSLVQKDAQYFNYDVDKKSWENQNIEKELMITDNILFKSEIVNVVGENNLIIPMRLTYRNDLLPNGNNPVLMHVYGGFGANGPINTKTFDPMLIEFLKKGGMYAAPAVRGGGELGPEWHSNSMLENKKHAMLDLITAAKWLVEKKWTNHKKIIATGTSNGGLTVASAALLSPGTFGLVIPVAGVHDLLNSKTLDAEFKGWTDEYGDPQIESNKKWMEQISPVTLADALNPQSNLPQFLIITGQKDTRVNPLHSYRLAEKLLAKSQQPEKIYLASINNAGHWLERVNYQDLIGWRTQVVKWTFIYDFLSFDP